MTAKTQPSRLTHPADNLYATSVNRLFELGACEGVRSSFIQAAERQGHTVLAATQVPITLALFVNVMEIDPCLGWLLNELVCGGLITDEEYEAADRGYFSPDWYTAEGQKDAASVVMNVLLVRAKREGLVPA